MTPTFNLTAHLMPHPIMCPVQQRAMQAAPIANDVLDANQRVEVLERQFVEVGMLVNDTANRLPLSEREAFLARLWPEVVKAGDLVEQARSARQTARLCADVWGRV